MANNDITVEEAIARLPPDGLQLMELWTDKTCSLDNLYADFSTSEQGPGAVGGDPVEAGKALLRNLHDRLSDVVCNSTTVRSIVQDPKANTADTIALCAVIAALIDSGPAKVVNSCLAAALIVRVGVRNFCALRWQ